MKHFIVVMIFLVLSVIASGTENSSRKQDKISSDTAWGSDGLGRLRGLGIFRVGHWHFGVSGRWDTEHNLLKGMVGFNSPFLVVGHLNDAGLASEIRNPSYTALSRLTERTLFRANLRSFSSASYGIAVNHPEYPVGFGWQKRPDITTAMFWVSPVDSGIWKLDFMGSGGVIERKNVGYNEPWYSDQPTRPHGPMVSAALRNTFELRAWMFGLTGIISAGENFNPGMLAAGSMYVSSSEWRFRMRTIWSSDYFRNAEGERLDEHTGLAWDLRYSVRRGFYFSTGFEMDFTDVMPSGDIAVGWRSPVFGIIGKMDWDWLENGLDIVKISGKIDISHGIHGIELDAWGNLENEWAAKGKWELQLGKVWTLQVFVGLEQSSLLLFDTGINLSLRYKKGKIILKAAFYDMPRDWRNGPSGAGDMDVEIRWLHRYSK